MDGGAWWAAVHGVMKSRTQLSNFTFTFHFHALEKEMAAHSSVLAWRIPDSKVLSALSISNGIWRSLYFLLSCFAFFYTEHLSIIFITLKEFPNVFKGGKARYVLCKFMYLLV